MYQILQRQDIPILKKLLKCGQAGSSAEIVDSEIGSAPHNMVKPP